MTNKSDKDILNDCIELLGSTNLGLPLVWLWTWDLMKSIMDDPDIDVLVSEDEAWALLVEDADKQEFTLEYGAEEHYDHVRDWMFIKGLITELAE